MGADSSGECQYYALASVKAIDYFNRTLNFTKPKYFHLDIEKAGA